MASRHSQRCVGGLTVSLLSCDGLRALSIVPQVANGASELLSEVFGERGKHARSAVGTNALPLNVPVEIEAILEVE